MNKKYNNGLLKTEISEDGKSVNFSISVAKLKWLFKNSPNNVEMNSIKNKDTYKFLDYLLTRLSDESIYDDNTVKWLLPFEEIFEDMYDEDFVIHHEDY
jgi:hypothetical protein